MAKTCSSTFTGFDMARFQIWFIRWYFMLWTVLMRQFPVRHGVPTVINFLCANLPPNLQELWSLIRHYPFGLRKLRSIVWSLCWHCSCLPARCSMKRIRHFSSWNAELFLNSCATDLFPSAAIMYWGTFWHIANSAGCRRVQLDTWEFVNGSSPFYPCFLNLF
jgi:hypothetical protein